MPSGGDGAWRALRYGAPAAVVDPLLSFLFDLQRMADTVVSALEHLGVDRHTLPPWAGCRRADGPAPAPPSEAPAADTATDPLEAYARDVSRGSPSAHALSAEEVAAQLLTWVDAQLPVPESSPAASLRLLAALVTATGAGADVVWRDTATQEETYARRASKRPRADASAAAPPLPAEGASPSGDAEALQCVAATLSAAELTTTAARWREYERTLKGSVAAMEATLAAVTTARVGGSYTCHAKWVEGTAGEADQPCVVPACAVLKRNYEELIHVEDAFATCQAAVHAAYAALEDSLDLLLEEAQVVARQERLFHRHVSAAHHECAALSALRVRIKPVRVALVRALHTHLKAAST
ncbi:hypothetical protein NESM_000830800 [Novymonas esmeraldas]|uniref:Ig-like domain-containing protein n=1 Tax=Novymonas esmeraldas TaxID=1808958 RepID=A0AAW0F075_9TRYP